MIIAEFCLDIPAPSHLCGLMWNDDAHKCKKQQKSMDSHLFPMKWSRIFQAFKLESIPCHNAEETKAIVVSTVVTLIA